MNLFRNLPISKKLPVFIATVCLMLALGLTLTSDVVTRTRAIDVQQRELMRIALSHQVGMEAWIEDVERDMLPLSNSPTVVEAIGSFTRGWESLESDAKTTLQTAYVTENPNPVGQRQLLDRPEARTTYNLQHQKYHPYFRQFREVNEYYDIFLINLDGDIIYSVFKENDFAENVMDDYLGGSGIDRAFQSAKDGLVGEIHFGSFTPYAPSDGTVAGFAASLVEDAFGTTLGVLVVQLNLFTMDQMIASNGLGTASYETYLVGPDATLRTPPSEISGLRRLDPVPDLPYIRAVLETGEANHFEGIGLRGEPALVAAVTFPVAGENWAIVAEELMTTVTAHANGLRNEMLKMSLIATLVASVIGWLFVRRISTAIAGVGTKMAKMADGDYSVEVSEAKRHDEIGDIGRVLLDFRNRLKTADDAEQDRFRLQENLQRVLDGFRGGLKGLSAGDLMQPITTVFHDDYESLRQDFNGALDQLNVAMSEVVVTANSIRDGATEITAASFDLSERTENQAATLEQTAVALDELTTSVRSAAESAKSVEQIVSDAQGSAEESGKTVQNAVTAMSEIEKSSEQISTIIGVIEDIAFQTNLLALNAGVEAARAGEAGRGFAVVASEVRALAQRSSDAASEIKTLIEGSSRQVNRGVDLVGRAGEALDHIVKRVAHISSLMTDMAAGTAEQAKGLGEINVGVSQLEEVTQQNVAMVEKSSASSHRLNQNADRLMTLMSGFNTSRSEAQGCDMSAFRPTADLHVVDQTAPAREEDQVATQKIVTLEPPPQPEVLEESDDGRTAAAGWQDF